MLVEKGREPNCDFRRATRDRQRSCQVYATCFRSMTNVLLFRAPSRPEDRYETAFKGAGYNALSVPVLETVSTNTANLKAIIETGPAAASLDGVIITSGRACEVWKTVIGNLPSSPASEASTSWCHSCTLDSPHIARLQTRAGPLYHSMSWDKRPPQRLLKSARSMDTLITLPISSAGSPPERVNASRSSSETSLARSPRSFSILLGTRTVILSRESYAKPLSSSSL